MAGIRQHWAKGRHTDSEIEAAINKKTQFLITSGTVPSSSSSVHGPSQQISQDVPQPVQSESSLSDLIACPICPPNRGKLYKGNRGLKMDY